MVCGVELRWFAPYLHQRRQRMLLSGVSSDWMQVHTGVPQGTILGSLLFTIFVDDLPRVVEHCSINLYADDTTIYCSARDPSDVRDQLGSDLSHVAK